MSDAALLESIVVDQHGVRIHHGDHVRVHGTETKGHVSKVVNTTEEAHAENVENPPKVIIDTEDNRRVHEEPHKIEVLVGREKPAKAADA